MKILQSLFSRGAKRDERAAGALALAKDLQKKGEPHAAMAAYREALDHGASAAPIHLQLGVLHASLSEHERAIEHLEKALESAQPLETPRSFMTVHGHDDMRRRRLGRELERFLEMLDGALMLGQAGVQHAELKMDRRGARPVIERLAVSRHGRVRFAFLLQVLGKRKRAGRALVSFRAAGKSDCKIFMCKW